MALDFIAIDFETANYYPTSACSVGLVRFIDGKEVDSVYSLILPKPLYFIPEWTRDIHHLSYSDVEGAASFTEVWNEVIEPFIQETPKIPFVAHNACFDMNVIRKCSEFYGMEIPKIKYFDSLRVSQRTWSELHCHKLTFLADRFGIVYDAHNALDDSRTCGKIITMAAEEKGVTTVKDLLGKCKCALRYL